MELLKVGLIGCGAIGTSIAEGIRDGKAGEIELNAVCDIEELRMKSLEEKLSNRNLIKTTKPEVLIKLKNIDLVIEAANKSIVEFYSESVLRSGKNLMIMSVGALNDKNLYHRIESLAREYGLKVYIPSGAICGLDGVKAAANARLERAEITTTKHPKSLAGAPYLEDYGIDITRITQTKVIFQGKADEAIKGFPKNVNVAVALSLASMGVDQTTVRIIADPMATHTIHEISVTGEFGELYTKVRNIIHPENPKTSYLAVLSAIRTLRNINDPIQIGT